MNINIVENIACNMEKRYGVRRLLEVIDNSEMLVNFNPREVADMLGNISGTINGGFTHFGNGDLIFNVSFNYVHFFEILNNNQFSFSADCFVNPCSSLKGLFVFGDIKSIILKFIITVNKDYHTGYPREIFKRDHTLLTKIYNKKIKEKYQYVHEYITATKDIDEAYYLYGMENYGEENAMDFVSFRYVYNLITGEFKNEM